MYNLPLVRVGQLRVWDSQIAVGGLKVWNAKTLLDPGATFQGLKSACPYLSLMGHDPIGTPTTHTPAPLLSQNADLLCTSSLSLLQTSPLANSGSLLRMTTGGEVVGVLVKASLDPPPEHIPNVIEHFLFCTNASLLRGPDRQIYHSCSSLSHLHVGLKHR